METLSGPVTNAKRQTTNALPSLSPLLSRHDAVGAEEKYRYASHAGHRGSTQRH